jgi:hypothetical protein
LPGGRRVARLLLEYHAGVSRRVLPQREKNYVSEEEAESGIGGYPTEKGLSSFEDKPLIFLVGHR